MSSVDTLPKSVKIAEKNLPKLLISRVSPTFVAKHSEASSPFTVAHRVRNSGQSSPIYPSNCQSESMLILLKQGHGCSRCIAEGLQAHAALGTLPWMVLTDFRVHRAVVNRFVRR